MVKATYMSIMKTNMKNNMKNNSSMFQYIWSKTPSISGISTTVSSVGSFLWDPLVYVWPKRITSRDEHSSKSGNSLSSSSGVGSYGTPGFLYAFVLDEKDQVFKVGKSVNIPNRIRSYKSTDYKQEGYVYHHVSCDDMDHAERILHNILKLNGHCIKLEMFKVPSKLLKEYMNLTQILCKKLRTIKDPSKVAKITHFLDQITY